MSNIEKYPKCHMRTSLGNCDPIGGFCTSVETDICEALHKTAKPKTGTWKEEYAGNGWNDFWDYTCSECGRKFYRFYKSNFCPNCGADMRGGESGCPMGLNQNDDEDEDEDWAIARGIALEHTRGGEDE